MKVDENKHLCPFCGHCQPFSSGGVCDHYFGEEKDGLFLVAAAFQGFWKTWESFVRDVTEGIEAFGAAAVDRFRIDMPDYHMLGELCALGKWAANRELVELFQLRRFRFLRRRDSTGQILVYIGEPERLRQLAEGMKLAVHFMMEYIPGCGDPHWNVCPICDRLNNSSRVDICKHYLGFLGDGSLDWCNDFDAFESAWSDIAELLYAYGEQHEENASWKDGLSAMVEARGYPSALVEEKELSATDAFLRLVELHSGDDIVIYGAGISWEGFPVYHEDPRVVVKATARLKRLEKHLRKWMKANP